MDWEPGPNVILHGAVRGENEDVCRKRKGLPEGCSEKFREKKEKKQAP